MQRLNTFLVLIFLIPLVGCGSGAKKSDAPGSAVLATVGDREITVDEYRLAYFRSGRSEVDSASTPSGRQALLTDLINKDLMELASHEAYPELPLPQQWRLHRLRESTLKDKVRNIAVEARVNITPGMRDSLFANLSRERHLFGMLIIDPNEAQYVREQLDAGGDFRQLSLDHSAQWSTPQEGGDMGWQSAGGLPWPLDREVWSAPVGSLIGPVAFPLGNYIIRVVDEREATVPGNRQNLEALLEERLREPLHLNEQKALIDSLDAYESPYYPPQGRQLLQFKYYWEPQTDNPLEYLEANRVRPTFTAAEETTIVVQFKHAPAWDAVEFAERLDWYAHGLWPRGHSEEQLLESLDLVVRNFLMLKCAEDWGLDQEPDFVEFLENREREMRVTYFYYNNIIAGVEPGPDQIDAYYNEQRDRYRSPSSYKVAVFSSKIPDLMPGLAEMWRGGAAFADVRDTYEAKDPELKSMGESRWIFVGEDPAADLVLATLEPGGVSAPDIQSGVASVYKLITRRDPRMITYEEAKEQIDTDAKTWYQEEALKNFLSGAREKFGVTINEQALQAMDLSTPLAD